MFPLRGGFVSQKVMFSPEGVLSLDESKDSVGVYVVTVGESISQDDPLECQDICPAGLYLYENGIEHKTAALIQGGDEIPFLF